MFIQASSYVDEYTLKSILKSCELDLNISTFKLKSPPSEIEPLSLMSIIDYKTFMSDDILTKVDRASMGVSLEAREPLIDHKIVEFMASVPNSIKYKGGVKKYLLKQVLYRHLPKELIERPKSGFQVPLMEWMRGDLREQIDHYLSEERLKKGRHSAR